jgi:hypothetical protein
MHNMPLISGIKWNVTTQISTFPGIVWYAHNCISILQYITCIGHDFRRKQSSWIILTGWITYYIKRKRIFRQCGVILIEWFRTFKNAYNLAMRLVPSVTIAVKCHDIWIICTFSKSSVRCFADIRVKMAKKCCYFSYFLVTYSEILLWDMRRNFPLRYSCSLIVILFFLPALHKPRSFQFNSFQFLSIYVTDYQSKCQI